MKGMERSRKEKGKGLSFYCAERQKKFRISLALQQTKERKEKEFMRKVKKGDRLLLKLLREGPKGFLRPNS